MMIPIVRSLFRVGRSPCGGLGLFAVKRIPPESYLEYVGEKILTKKADTMKRARYLCVIDDTWTIDGKSRQNIARYFNHSCDPNFEYRSIKGHVYIVSLRTIEPGEEMTFDYGSEYVDAFFRKDGCQCAKCRTR